MKLLPRMSWRNSRRISQVAFLLLFLALFRATEYGSGSLHSSTLDFWFAIDPLVGATSMLAAKTIIIALLPALVLVAMTLVLGRFFCGWVCPLGTLLDAFSRAVRPVARRTRRRLHLHGRRLRSVKYFLLAALVVLALFNVMLVGWFDPFALLYRGLALAADPFVAQGADDLFGKLYMDAPDWVTAVSEPTYRFLSDHILPHQRASFALSGVAGGMLLAIFALELAERRFWCRNLCPLGALYGLLGRFSLVRRFPVKMCNGCGECADLCRMGAFDAGGRFVPDECNLCMDCVNSCPRSIATFGTKKLRTQPAPMQPSRRVFLAAAVSGVAVPLASKTARAWTGNAAPAVLRPPGAVDSDRFTDLCIRCGECLKVCPTNGLQPTLLEAGWESMFSPRLVPRTGYCEYNCTLCGQVCPSGAIEKLTVDAKHASDNRIGIAEFDHDRCLPWAENEACICCEEMCPVPDKAIRLETVRVQNDAGEWIELDRPYVCEERCIGCGICENACPLDGKAGIRVTTRTKPQKRREKQRRHRGGARRAF